MREIKFRGKRLDNRGWLYGSLLVSHFKDDKKERYFITQFSGNYTFEHEVDPATVGQYTGLKDRREKDAYFGDIVRFGIEHYSANTAMQTTISYFIGVISYDEFGHSCLKMQHAEAHINNLKNGEVIGNIHDNPELLKGGAQ